MSAEFVHLHNHSEYSLLDGACRLSDMIKTAKSLGMSALALTDHGGLFGAVEFYTTAQDAGIKPIIGCELYICGNRHEKTTSHSMRDDVANHLLLLAKNEAGYRNLVKLSSIGYTEGFYYRPRIDHELLAGHTEGLIATSGCMASEIPTLFLSGREKEAKERAGWYRDLFGDDYYVEIQRHGMEDENELNGRLRDLAAWLGRPLVATNDTHYLKREHAAAHDALLCIGTGTFVSDESRLRFPSDQFYLKSPDEMAELFEDIPEALKSTLEIAEKCRLELDLTQRYLPAYPLPDGETDVDNFLAKSARAGLVKRYAAVTPELTERLEHELTVIKQMGFAGYFLIVADFVNHARQIGVAVGPGRGSAAGSLVCFSLGITNLDPIRFNLVFERFLNPDRITMPDIDIDFQDDGRDKVIEYVREKYGADSVTQIITFGRMKARAVLRDVGRVLGQGYGEVDKLAKLIPEGPNVKLEKSRQDSAQLKRALEDNEQYRRIWEIGTTLEGTCRHASTHAAGVVITPGPLTDYVPLYRQSDGSVTTQYDMNIVDSIGLLKMDFLGLRTLGVLAKAKELLQRRGVDIDLDAVLEEYDEKTYDLFARGDTVGVFQLESRGMREWLAKLKPTCIDDIVAMVALYRPGPMEMIGDFIRRKHGEQKITYLHPKMEPILKSTYGVIVYQEQVLQISRELAGFTMGAADILRRAMGKKKAREMEKVKKDFIKGCLKHSNVKEKLANQIYDLVFKFSQYGFVKAHAASYAVLAYQTAYLKANYPAEFMAAEMSSWRGETRAMPKLIHDCRRAAIGIRPPDINHSEESFSVEEGEIRCGLESIKNVGRGPIRSILQARSEGGKFISFFDFAERVDVRQVNRKCLESLICAGALDGLAGDRSQFLAAVDSFFAHAGQATAAREMGQSSLFGDAGGEEHGLSEPELPDVPSLSTEQRLSFERDLLGYYVSGHPLDDISEDIERLANAALGDTSELVDQQMVRLAGVVSSVRQAKTKKGKTMATVTVEDLTGSGELLLFSDVLDKYAPMLRKEAKLVFVTRVSCREDEDPKFIVQNVYSIEEARAVFAQSMWLTLTDNRWNQETLDALEELFLDHSGSVPVYFRIKKNGRERTVKSRRYRLETSLSVVREIENMLGTDHVRIG